MFFGPPRPNVAAGERRGRSRITALKTTRYFDQQVLRKRPYIRREWCAAVIANPVRREIQPSGRVRYWGFVAEMGNRALRVVTLADGETVHNAFFDRGFAEVER